jgi:starch phosphorylase
MIAFEPFVGRCRIAYFTMEIALRPEMHTYSGGLGVLAGDTARTAADLELPMIFVTLVSRAGYLHQQIDGEGRQKSAADPWPPDAWTKPLSAKVAIDLAGREVWVRPWLYEVRSGFGGVVPVILLDTQLDENHPDDRTITDRLYGDDGAIRLKQEAVLGIGGVRLLQALGVTVETYHLNEGHAALLCLELLRHHPRAPAEVCVFEPAYEVGAVRRRCVFTTHTPVEAGHDRFSYDIVQAVLGTYLPVSELRLLAGDEVLNMTRLALNLSGYVNGVAEKHAQTSAQMFPGYRVRAITNGVHLATWASPGFARLFDANLAHWRREPELLSRADLLPDEAVWDAHVEAKRALFAEVRAQTGVVLDESAATIGFARRMTGYKRPGLIFREPERLRALSSRHPFQMVIAGKAHPRDESGLHLIEFVQSQMRMLGTSVRIAYLPNYDLALAPLVVAGTDIWLNTPLPPFEASGTSGMKAALNGVLNFSTMDGWWIEGWIEGQTGWSIGDHGGSEFDVEELYGKLGSVILPLYYRNRAAWIGMMKQSIARIAPYFSSHRMMWHYLSEAYVR